MLQGVTRKQNKIGPWCVHAAAEVQEIGVEDAQSSPGASVIPSSIRGPEKVIAYQAHGGGLGAEQGSCGKKSPFHLNTIDWLAHSLFFRAFATSGPPARSF